MDKNADYQDVDFEIDDDFLEVAIKHQSGSLLSAISELVMNSVDAGASTIDVTIGADEISVADNGKGFTLPELESHFNTFAFDHGENNQRTFGEYGLGRGQAMALGKVTYQTGCYQMEVDIRSKGLNWDLLTHKRPVHEGCKVSCAPYQPLNEPQVESLVDELKEKIKYIGCNIRINGNLATRNIAKSKNLITTDDAYMRLSTDPSSQLSLYNNGILVRHYRHSEFGIGGVVVTRRRMKLNIARNEAVPNCDVFKSVKKTLRKNAPKIEGGNVNRRTSKLANLKAFLLGDSIYNRKIGALIPLADGKWLDIVDLLSGLSRGGNMLYVTVGEPSDKWSSYDIKNLSETAHHTGVACVLSDELYEITGEDCPKDLIASLYCSVKNYAIEHNQMQILDYQIDKGLESKAVYFDQIIDQLVEMRKRTVKTSDLSALEKIILSTINKYSTYIANNVSRITDNETEKRTVFIGQSSQADAWTMDSRIWINRTLIDPHRADGDFTLLFDRVHKAMIHEYLHHEDTVSAHGHPKAFYSAYADCISDESYVLNAILDDFAGRIKKSKGVSLMDKPRNLAEKPVKLTTKEKAEGDNSTIAREEIINSEASGEQQEIDFGS